MKSIGIIYLYLNAFNNLQTEMDDWKNDLRKQWEESKKLPRKKKKQLRKEIKLNWMIANWESDIGCW